VYEGWVERLRLLGSETLECRVHMDAPDAAARIGGALARYGAPYIRNADAVVVLCVGTDRAIGDALGPLVGSWLEESGPHPYAVLGTLDKPVHAANLVETLKTLERTYRRPFVVAVDACLGRSESVGMLTVGQGSLRPGAGVNKQLPKVGHVYVTGVVNVGGFMEYFVLQNTRLNLVMRMAKVAALGIAQGLGALCRQWSAAGDPT